MFISHKDYVAAVASIAAARAAARDVFLPAKSQATVAAVAGFDQNSNFIDEHGTPKIQKPPVPIEPAAFRNCFARFTRLRHCCDVDADELAHASAVFELHYARYLCEERIVLAPADVRARLDLGAAL